MAGNSVWKVTFHLENSAGKTVAGPYSAFVGVAGGARSDIHGTANAASLLTAINNTPAAIIAAHGTGPNGNAPSGTVVIEYAAHAATPEVFT